MAIWEENKHPRDKSGQFTSKGNEGQGGKKEETKKITKEIEIDDDYERSYGPAPDKEEDSEGYKKYMDSYKKWQDKNFDEDFDNDFEEEFLDIGEIVADSEYVYFGIDDKDKFIDLLHSRDNVPIDKAKEWVEKNWDQLQEYQNEDEFDSDSSDINDTEIDYENVEYPKGTSKEYTNVINKKYQNSLPILEKAGIKLEDFGGKASAEDGYEDNSKEIMDKYVFEPFRKKYPNGDNDAWEKEYQPLYDAIESVLDKKYNDWWIRNKGEKNSNDDLPF